MQNQNTRRSATWKTASAQVIGRSHEENGKPIEDSIRICHSRNQEGEAVVTACVSDGAGSAVNSRTGAKLTSWAVTNWLSCRFDPRERLSRRETCDAVFAFLKRWLRRASEEKNCRVKQFASTLVAVAVYGTEDWIAMHLGDGAVIGRFGSVVAPISMPQKGEFANETFFVTDTDGAMNLKVYGSMFGDSDTCPSGFALFCDGLEGMLINRHTAAVAPAVPKMFSWLDANREEVVTAALHSNIKDVFRPETRDDCSIVLMSNGGC